MQQPTFKELMAYQPVLPENFDGTFKFTNPSDEDFIGVWGKKEYFFPANKTVRMVMPEHSPLEVQHIRKKFAKKLAEREFYKSQQYKVLSDQEGKPGDRRFNSIHQAATYTENDLIPWIQACLEPKEEATLTVQPANMPSVEDKLHRDDDGKLITEAIDGKTSLKQKAQQM